MMLSDSSSSSSLASPSSLRASMSLTSVALLVREVAQQVLLELGKHVEGGAERADADDPVEALRVVRDEVKREMPAPRVADRPRLVELERVEHRERVGHVRLDRVRPADRRGQRAALRVADRREEVAELGRAALGHVGEARPSVEEQGGGALPAVVAVERSVADLELERCLRPRPLTLRGALDRGQAERGRQAGRRLLERIVERSPDSGLTA